MTLLLLLSCVHKPPSPGPPLPWQRSVVRRAEVSPDGLSCTWEAEELVTAGGTLWAVSPPDALEGTHNEDWCVGGGEASRTFDVTGQRGPYLSTRLHEERCCPARETRLCVTWDLRTRAPASLGEVDPRDGARRWAEFAARAQTDPALAGWRFSPDEFLLVGDHLRFCGRRDGELREVDAG